MTGIEQQIPSFSFVAAENGIAAEKVQVNSILENQFRA